MAEHYDVYYRVHAPTYGWLAWTKNGEAAGTAGLSKHLEGIQIVLVPKGLSLIHIYRIRNQQLAYIMEQTAGGDEFLVIFGQIQPVSEDIADERDV